STTADGSVHLKRLSDGTDTVLDQNPDYWDFGTWAYLVPAGVLLGNPSGSSFRLWKDGTFTPVTPPDWDSEVNPSMSILRVKNGYTVYTVYGHGDYLLNTNTGKSVKFASASGSDNLYGNWDMSESGELYYTASGGIYKFDPADGTTTELYAYPDAETSYKEPLVTGSTLVFSDYEKLYELSEGTVKELASNLSMSRDSYYQVNQGWLLYTGRTPAEQAGQGEFCFFLRSPQGETRVLPQDTYQISIDKLQADGTFSYFKEGVQYVGDTYIGGSYDKTFWVNGQGYKVIDGALYSIQVDAPPPVTPPFWPVPQPLTVSSATYDSITVAWQPAQEDKETVQGYNLYQASDIAEFSTSVGGDVLQYTFTGLKPGTAYEFRVVPYNHLGYPGETALIQASTTSAPAASSTLALKLNTGRIQVGRVAEVTLKAEQVTDLYGFLAKLEYDPAKLKLMQAVLHNDFGRENSTAVLGKVLGANGKVKLSGSLLGPVPGKGGSPSLVTLKFIPQKSGSTDVVLHTDSAYSDSQGKLSAPAAPSKVTLQVGP
ncbi:fibronectin type III domain-containing protein, partial [Paenibacillus sp. KR2-11]|uniref:fibronectin type III domain-containing protein n=1 Tax=Paenibacillus sp. KR2-11 TaxID=3385500 RepID=UPI0038FCB5BC